MRTYFLLFLALAWVGEFGKTSFADSYPYYAPKLTNDKGGDLHDFPMGVLSATGRMHNGAMVILIKHIASDGPGAAGGLQQGDIITAIEGRRMPPYSKELDAGVCGPQLMLAQALDQACAKKEPQLKLTVERNQETLKLTIDLPPSPSYGRSFPAQSEKADAYRQATYRWLVENQESDGGWRTGVGGDSRDYTAAFCGLALLSSNNSEYLPNIERAVKFVRGAAIAAIDLENPRGGPKNWITGAAAIFLAEYHLATQDESVLPDLQNCCDLLAARVSANGRMGHGYEVTYDGGGLTIINAHAHLAWALAGHAGCKIDAAAWNRSLGEISKAMTKEGAVGYSSAARGDKDAPARTGGMAAALVLSKQQPQMSASMGRWLIVKNNRMRHAHTNAAMGLIFGTAGIKLSNPGAIKGHLNNWLPYLELCRTANGPAAYLGSKRNFGGDEYLGLSPQANATVALMLASPEDHLFLLGGSKKGWFGKQVEASKKEPRGRTPRSVESSPANPVPAETKQYREWTSHDGRFQVRAQLVEIKEGQVTLHRADNGQKITVPLDRLSEEDQTFLKGDSRR